MSLNVDLRRLMSGRTIIGDALTELRKLPDKSVQMCITSPPYYWMRDYESPGDLGLEPTIQEYVANLVKIFAEVHRVLKDDGTCWLNIGDKYTNYGKYKKEQRKDVEKWPKQQRNKGTHRRPRMIDNKQGNPEFTRPCRTETKRPASMPRQKNIKEKDLMMVPAEVAIALRNWGWHLRADIVWAKTNPMPESVINRPTRSHEFVYLLSKKHKYFYDHEAIMEPYKEVSVSRLNRAFNANEERDYVGGGKQNLNKFNKSDRAKERAKKGRNKRSVWNLSVSSYKGGHFATFPASLVEVAVLAGCPPGGVVLDPFLGSGTVGEVAERLGRKWIGIEINEKYLPLIEERTGQKGLRL